MANVKHNIILGMDARQFRSEMDKMQGSISKLQSNFLKMASVASSIYATAEIIRYAGEVEKLGKEVVNVTNAFSRLKNSDALLNDIRTATKGSGNRSGSNEAGHKVSKL
jgi:division protein CdvB (Snf7/Vps24/ESCRT-III family)